MKYRWFLLFAFLTFCHSALALNGKVITPAVDTPKEALINDLLQLALSKTTACTIFTAYPERLSTGRMTEQIINGKLDVFWAGMSPSLEETLLPIRIPIFKGLIGHRIFVIKAGDEKKFSHITTLQQLKQLTAGQGQFWGDTAILENAGLPVTKAVKGDNLWSMLDEKRFDYLALAIHEPWTELQRRSNLSLAVEQNILLIYPFAMYFYVSPKNTLLYEQIKTGMNIAIEDGSYDELLFNSPMIREALALANVSTRRIIRIDNKTMHPNTPIHIKHYWFDPLAPLPSP
ncbi:diguanylate cyclase [Saccharophagus degradans]|uniref:Diguanylate cyclase n=1 Tax=Saccharophagus degradans TaxID=86304 RepID=A0AAW7X726_9GAMM|nr:diguanylate cyclase [Saccharophagus degradans]MDO6422551.1 diguanylate cyclase [Saccharophagus degradans]MDO6607032.1 diguanylate cyclase [Saccharophagus degradans]